MQICLINVSSTQKVRSGACEVVFLQIRHYSKILVLFWGIFALVFLPPVHMTFHFDHQLSTKEQISFFNLVQI